VSWTTFPGDDTPLLFTVVGEDTTTEGTVWATPATADAANTKAGNHTLF
jgi:hypothetical protein